LAAAQAVDSNCQTHIGALVVAKTARDDTIGGRGGQDGQEGGQEDGQEDGQDEYTIDCISDAALARTRGTRIYHVYWKPHGTQGADEADEFRKTCQPQEGFVELT
jgi:hypothetical protein